jgi:hypothetical protein
MADDFINVLSSEEPEEPAPKKRTRGKKVLELNCNENILTELNTSWKECRRREISHTDALTRARFLRMAQLILKDATPSNLSDGINLDDQRRAKDELDILEKWEESEGLGHRSESGKKKPQAKGEKEPEEEADELEEV